MLVIIIMLVKSPGFLFVSLYIYLLFIGWFKKSVAMEWMIQDNIYLAMQY